VSDVLHCQSICRTLCASSTASQKGLGQECTWMYIEGHRLCSWLQPMNVVYDATQSSDLSKAATKQLDESRSRAVHHTIKILCKVQQNPGLPV
jgi:hypothetical protein